MISLEMSYFFFSIIIVFLFFFLYNWNFSLSLLLIAELIWISLYLMALILGFFLDDFGILSLTFFFLVLSAVEFGVGLILILFQQWVLRAGTSMASNADISRFLLTLTRVQPIKKINWKL